jgi:hypothetical protein
MMEDGAGATVLVLSLSFVAQAKGPYVRFGQTVSYQQRMQIKRDQTPFTRG